MSSESCTLLWCRRVKLGWLVACVLTTTFASAAKLISLPQGEIEVVASTGFSGSVLRLGPQGEVLSWADAEGNMLLQPGGKTWQQTFHALELLNGTGKQGLLPDDVATFNRDELQTTHPDGASLRFIVEPARLGVRVDGPAATYRLRGRNTCRMERCRLVLPDAVRFASAGLDSPQAGHQTWVDERLGRALRLEPPAGRKIVWEITQTDGWANQWEHVAWTLDVAPGETVWLSSVAIPPYSGPVKVGLYSRTAFRPDTRRAVATLPRTGVAPGDEIHTVLSKPPPELIADGRLQAVLFPTEPRDAVDETEHARWYHRYDQAAASMTFLSAIPTDEGAVLRVPSQLAPGSYRLRLVVTTEAPLDFAPYFPGFTGRGGQIHQSDLIGDVLVSVGPTDTGSMRILQPAGRTAFWRGERVIVQLRSSIEHTQGRLELRRDGVVLASHELGGLAVSEWQFDTTELAPGVYEVRATAVETEDASYYFTVAPPREAGMVVVNSPLRGPGDLAAHARLGVNMWADVMPRASGPGWQEAPMVHNRLVADNWLFLQGIQSRQISFGLHHSIPEHISETLRKHLVFSQYRASTPSMLGSIFDYDVSGIGPGLGYCEPYRKAGKRKAAALAERWRQAWELAQADGATDDDERRLRHLFYAGIFDNMYGRSVERLHEVLPWQRHSTAATADHTDIEHGQYLPSIYQSLDFRYMEAWNDQIYPNGAHDMQESFWTSLLRVEQDPSQPIWITSPAAPQPGTHFRRALETIACGAAGTGYNAEGRCGLTGGWGAVPANSTLRAAQEALTGDLATRYGAWLRAFEPVANVAILYSVSQGGDNWGMKSHPFFAWFALAEYNRPARLFSEDEIAAGALASVEALVVVGQTIPLPGNVLDAIGAFTHAGGVVVCDGKTTVDLSGATRLPDLKWPHWLWPSRGNAYHRLLMDLVRENGPRLVEALGDIGRPALECRDGGARIRSARRGGTTVVTITNNERYPFDELFTEEQQHSQFSRRFSNGGSVYSKDVRVPRYVRLHLRDDLRADRPHVYDIFAGRELRWGDDDSLQVDLATLSARVLMLTQDPLPLPAVQVSRRERAPAVTVVTRSDVPLPVCIEMGAQRVYRVADPEGSCDTFAAPGGRLVVTELALGRQQRAELAPAKPPRADLSQLPTVQVWEPGWVYDILNTEGLAVYVDARQAGSRDLATDFARKLGSTANVIFAPDIHDYPLKWDPSAEDETIKTRILEERLPARRRPAEPRLQWTGAMHPATLWNRPVVLFGHAGNNALIADLDKNTLLDRPARGDLLGPGQAIVRPLAAPFWHGNDAIVVLCSDSAGMEAAIDQLLRAARGRPLDATLSRMDDDRARRERRRLLGLQPHEYPSHLQTVETVLESVPVSLPPVVPVASCRLLDDGVLAAIHSPGRNLIRLDAAGSESWRYATAGYYQPTALYASANGECVVGDEAFVWRHAAGGALLWKTLGRPVAPPLPDGNVWVQRGTTLLHFDARGGLLRRLSLDGTLLTMWPDQRHALVRRDGPREQHRKSGAILAAVDLATGSNSWQVAGLDAAEVVVSADGQVVACVEHEHLGNRDDLGRGDFSRLTALDAATGAILLRQPMGVPLQHLQLSADGARLAVSGRGFSDSVYLANVDSGRVRRIVLPEAGVWARTMSADGGMLWFAADALYRVDWESASPANVLGRRLLSLQSLGEGGGVATTPQGDILWLNGDGHVVREMSLLKGLDVDCASDFLTPLRNAPLVSSPTLLPNDVGSVIALGPEYTAPHMRRRDAAAVRGDGIKPVVTSVRIPKAGMYRFEVELTNPDKDLDKIKYLRLRVEGKWHQADWVDDNPRLQAALLTLEPGIIDVAIAPRLWKCEAWLHALVVTESANE